MTWTLQSMDISGVGRAPNIDYEFAEDNASFEASPPGGHIRVEALTEENARVPEVTTDMLVNGRFSRARSRVVLTNTLTNEVFADIVVRHVSTPSTDDWWNDTATYAGEVAAALYWSMWRMQQLKAATVVPRGEG